MEERKGKSSYSHLPSLNNSLFFDPTPMILVLQRILQRVRAKQSSTMADEDEPGANNSERVKAYLLLRPEAKVRDVAEALSISVSTANKWMSRVKA